MKSSAWIRGYMDSHSLHHTQSSDASEPPSKWACTSHSFLSASTSATKPVVISDDSATVNNMAAPSNSNNIAANKARQNGGRNGGVPLNAIPNLSPAALMTLISCIPDQKLQFVSAPSQGVSALQPSQSPSPSMARQQQLTILLSTLLGMSSSQVQQPSSLAAPSP